MEGFAQSTVVWSLVGVQSAGLFGACLSRVTRGTCVEGSCQWLFLALLAVVGLATLVAMLLGPGYCLACGATLAIMLLAAVWDFGRAGSHSGSGRSPQL